MPKRNYKSDSLYHTNRLEYWKQKDHVSASESDNNVKFMPNFSEFEKSVGFCGSSWDYNNESIGLTRGRNGSVYIGNDYCKLYPNLTAGIDSLYGYNYDYGVDISGAIELCQIAWIKFQLFRNTIEAMVEFSNSPIHLKGKNKSAIKFIEKWLKVIDVNSLADQFFRELYRSCNVFIYQIDGRIKEKDFKEIKTLLGATGESLPVKYTILNPAQISLEYDVLGNYTYSRILSQKEIEKLRNPKTEIDKLAYKNLEPQIAKQLKTGLYKEQLYIPLESDKISYIPYQKQDYEPLAIPLFYGVLQDIELKLEMKHTDHVILRTVENMILLVTLGGMKDEEGRELAPNPEHMAYMKGLFENKSIQRVLVSDFTTKVDFVIPDLKKVLGKDKYEQVNEDIREGLQTIFGGNEKFANQMTKAKLFLERLNEGRRRFLNFLENEIIEVCKIMGFRECPKPEMEEIDLEDQTQMNRIYTRLVELGVIVPDDGIKAIKTGLLPDKFQNVANQKTFLEEKEEGLYYPQMFNNENPLSSDSQSGGNESMPNESGRPSGSTQPLSSPRKERVLGNHKEELPLISFENLTPIANKANQLLTATKENLKKKFQIDSLSENQEGMALNFCNEIMANSKPDDWSKSLENLMAKEEVTNNPEINEGVNEIMSMFNSPKYSACIVYHSNPLK